MTQDAAQARKGTGLSVAGWPLGRKMALALAIPLLLAAVLGGLRVAGDYGDSRQAARSAQQVTIIQPAVDYLTASETAMVAAQSDSAASQGDLIDAISDISTNAETLVAGPRQRPSSTSCRPPTSTRCSTSARPCAARVPRRSARPPGSPSCVSSSPASPSSSPA